MIIAFDIAARYKQKEVSFIISWYVHMIHYILYSQNSGELYYIRITSHNCIQVAQISNSMKHPRNFNFVFVSQY